MNIEKGIPLDHRTIEEVLHTLTTCPLCGSMLHFSYLTDYVANDVKEKASCQTCQMKMRENSFTLQ